MGSSISVCVRRYAAYPLSLRNLEEVLAKRGIAVDHATVHRWAIKLRRVLEWAFRSCRRTVGRRRISQGLARSIARLPMHRAGSFGDRDLRRLVWRVSVLGRPELCERRHVLSSLALRS